MAKEQNITNTETRGLLMSFIEKQDKEIYEVIQNEFNRQNNNIELIASENFVIEVVADTC